MIVLDASAWVDVLTAGAATTLLDDRIAVPPHFDAEVVGAVRALVQRGVLTPDLAELAVDRHLRAPFEREFESDDLRTAWRMREAMSLADGWYVALARRLGATWVTSDLRAAEAARRLGVQVATT
ncbi:MAG: type II toxin-antitoxin system VapC family toxin [Actinomycetota bacterium]|nr:type II toxin-antitoxin system VapC family toxin [Actinomycetota bacterium]